MKSGIQIKSVFAEMFKKLDADNTILIRLGIPFPNPALVNENQTKEMIIEEAVNFFGEYFKDLLTGENTIAEVGTT
jgi:TPP-dependent indolepyruvate ferredoxin oxidoreductase alpha subunit